MRQPINRPRPWYRRMGCGGCLLLPVLAILLVFAVDVLLSPWAVHIGGSATPRLSWDGYGEGVTPAGAQVIVALSLGPRLARGKRACRGCGDLAGSGALCTANAAISFRSLGGKLHAYWSTEGSTMTVQLYGATGDAGTFEVDLQGTWRGNSYTASDQSNLWEHLSADGHFHAGYTAPRSPQVTALQIHGGSRDAFKAACRRLAAG